MIQFYQISGERFGDDQCSIVWRLLLTRGAGMYCEDATAWTVKVIGYSRVKSPLTFDLEKILDCVTSCLQHPEHSDTTDS